jgi:hypothetical protein
VEKALTRAKRAKLLHEACGYANLLEADKLASTQAAFGAHRLLFLGISRT